MNRVLLSAWLLSFFSRALIGEPVLTDLVNQYRDSRGLSVLVPEEALEKTAELYCEELVETGILSHEDGNGDRVFNRYRKTGGTANKAGEILGTSPDPDSLFQAWLDSSSHERILSSPDWLRIGSSLKKKGDQYVAVVLFSDSLIEAMEISPADSGINLVLKIIPGHKARIRGIEGEGIDEISLAVPEEELPLLLVLEGYRAEKWVAHDFVYQSDNF